MPIDLGSIRQQILARFTMIAAERPVTEADVNALLQTLPLRLPFEPYYEWFKRARNLTKVIPFPRIRFDYLTEVQRYVADSRDDSDALPEIPLYSMDRQFRLQVQPLPKNKLQLTVEALGPASDRYANRMIGIAAASSKEQLLLVLTLNHDGEASDSSLDNTKAVRKALLNPIIALIGRDDS